LTFIDAHRDTTTGGRRRGVEPIPETLGVAPPSYYSRKSRALRDALLLPVLLALWVANVSTVESDERFCVEHLHAERGLLRWRDGSQVA